MHTFIRLAMIVLLYLAILYESTRHNVLDERAGLTITLEVPTNEIDSYLHISAKKPSTNVNV